MTRGTGRTTDQMKSAPQKAVYVWCNHNFAYPKGLMRKIGREDLMLVGPEWLRQHRYRGLSMTGLVIDHAVYEIFRSERLAELLMCEKYARCYVR